MTIIAPQWFLGQLMSMFIFLLILILGFLKFLSSNCPKQCQLYCPNIARSENQFWNANKPLALLLSCPLYECKISSWHLFRLLTTCYRLTLKLALYEAILILNKICSKIQAQSLPLFVCLRSEGSWTDHHHHQVLLVWGEFCLVFNSLVITVPNYSQSELWGKKQRTLPWNSFGSEEEHSGKINVEPGW